MKVGEEREGGFIFTLCLLWPLKLVVITVLKGYLANSPVRIAGRWVRGQTETPLPSPTTHSCLLAQQVSLLNLLPGFGLEIRLVLEERCICDSDKLKVKPVLLEPPLHVVDFLFAV